MHLQDKIGGGGAVGIIWRDGLYVLVPLCSSVSLESADIHEEFGCLLCRFYLLCVYKPEMILFPLPRSGSIPPSTLVMEQVSHSKCGQYGHTTNVQNVLRVINSNTHVSLLLKTKNGKQKQQKQVSR
jgi:hypothetical protein